LGVTRKILTVGAWILASILGLGVAAYAIAVAVNWRDQEPSAAALSLAAAHRDRPALPDADNAFIYAMGFAVSPGDDPRSMGSKRVAWMQQRQTGASTAPDPLGERVDYGLKRPAAITKLIEECQSDARACNELFSAGDGAFLDWTAAEGGLLQRYQTLIAHTGWKETVPYDLSMPMPAYARVVDGQRLLLMNARMLAKKGDHGAVKKLLEDDLRFWRTVLESSDILITRMIATGALNRHFEWGNLVLKELAPANAALAMPAQWEAALTDSERSFRRCLAGEWLFTSSLLRSLSITPYWPDLAMSSGEDSSSLDQFINGLMHPLYQPQDSINAFALHYSQLAELLDAPLRNYQTALERSQAANERWQADTSRSLSLYNIVGRRVVAEGATDFGFYAARVNDIEGVRRAALTATRLRERNVPASEVAAALETASPRNPYNDRPFGWDAAQGAIVFTGLQTGPRGEHRIEY
jgi:hypothetical protein